MTTKTKPPKAHPPIPPDFRLATEKDRKGEKPPKDPEIVSQVHEQLRKQTQELNEALVGKPQPAFGPGSDDLFNWPEIPKEATHARILQSGGAMWYNFDPDSRPKTGDRSGIIAVGDYTIPPNLDWRTSKRRRPQVIQKSQEARDEEAFEDWYEANCEVGSQDDVKLAYFAALRYARSPQNGGGK